MQNEALSAAVCDQSEVAAQIRFHEAQIGTDFSRASFNKPAYQQSGLDSHQGHSEGKRRCTHEIRNYVI